MKELIFEKTSILYLILTGISVPILHFTDKYIFSDWEFAIFLFIMMMLDTFVGIWKHWIKKDISSEGFSHFFTKFIIYSITLILVHNMTNYTEVGETNGFFGWIDNIIYALLMAREALSILESMVAINANLLPKWVRTHLMRSLKEFDETGNFNLEDEEIKEDEQA
jgi:phage-related holin